jgi:hypothetical protein
MSPTKTEAYKLEFKISKCGEEVPVLNDKPIHSLYDSSDEISNFLSKNLNKIRSSKYMIILGLGNGNYINQLLNINHKLNVLVIEPVKELVERYPQNNVQVKIISDWNPSTILRSEMLIYFVSHRAPILIHPGSYQSNKIFYEQFLTFRVSDRSYKIGDSKYESGTISFNNRKSDFLAACLNTMSEKSMESI